MPKPIHQIQEELEAIEADIPQFIKTGIPANVKSDKHRSLEERANTADQDILEHIVAFYANMGMVISGPGNPNVNPPVEDYGTGQLFQQVNQSTGDAIALWIFTGTDSLGWWKFQNFEADTATKFYGDIVNPNEEAIPDLPSANPFKVGDYYVRTSTGDADGDIEGVWLYIGLAVGDQWINLTAGPGGVSAFTQLDDAPSSYTDHAGKVVKVNEDEDGLEFGDVPENIEDTASGIKVTGNARADGIIGKSVTANITGSYAIDFLNIAEHYILTMTDNTSITFSNLITEDETAVITLTVSGNYSMTLPSWIKASPNNDDYSTTELNEIVINIKRGGVSPLGYYTLTNYPI